MPSFSLQPYLLLGFLEDSVGFSHSDIMQCSHLDFENRESQRHLLEKVGVPQCKFEEILGKTGVPCPKVGVKDSKYGVNEKPDNVHVFLLFPCKISEQNKKKQNKSTIVVLYRSRDTIANYMGMAAILTFKS